MIFFGNHCINLMRNQNKIICLNLSEFIKKLIVKKVDTKCLNGKIQKHIASGVLQFKWKPFCHAQV